MESYAKSFGSVNGVGQVGSLNLLLTVFTSISRNSGTGCTGNAIFWVRPRILLLQWKRMASAAITVRNATGISAIVLVYIFGISANYCGFANIIALVSSTICSQIAFVFCRMTSYL